MLLSYRTEKLEILEAEKVLLCSIEKCGKYINPNGSNMFYTCKEVKCASAKESKLWDSFDVLLVIGIYTTSTGCHLGI